MRSSIALLALIAELCAAQRVLHWVIRVSSLEDTVGFATEVLGMKVLRHEENAEPCPLTCNGVFDTPWSKTMVGYGPEDEHYALELTYNYGIAEYERGEGLQRFLLHIEGASAALDRARTRGLAVEGNVVVGPDQYRYELVERAPDGRFEGGQPFGAVVLRTADAAALAKWYHDTLGMHAEPAQGGSYRVSFPDSPLKVGFVIEPTPDGAPPKIEQWEGRNAIALPEKDVRAINDKLLAESPGLIIHTMRELHEKLGTLFILILRDVGGYEVCLVSIETFDPSVREATNYVGPNWEERKQTLERVAGLAALDAARKKMLEAWQQRQAAADDDEDDDDEEEEGDDDDDDDAEGAAGAAKASSANKAEL